MLKKMALLCGFAAAPAFGQAIMTFDPLTPGDSFGDSNGDLAGDVVYAEDGITMAVTTFNLGTFSNFGNVSVGTLNASDAMFTGNTNMVFDFTGLGFVVDTVTFEFEDSGGDENLGVNGTVLELFNFGLAPATIAGIDVTVGANTVTLSGGPISTITIGGQELAIDNISATPTPGPAGVLALGGLVASRRRR